MKVQIINHSQGREHPEIEISTFLKNTDKFVQSLKITFRKEDDGFDKTITIDDFGEVQVKEK